MADGRQLAGTSNLLKEAPLSQPHIRFSPARLKALRQAADLTRTQLAYRVGRSEQTVWEWERGNITPKIEMLGVMCSVLNCTISDLFESANDETLTAA